MPRGFLRRLLTDLKMSDRAPAPPSRQTRPAAFYKESSIEDYSDLILANDDVLEGSSVFFK
jgi:hypothetical protein